MWWENSHHLWNAFTCLEMLPGKKFFSCYLWQKIPWEDWLKPISVSRRCMVWLARPGSYIYAMLRRRGKDSESAPLKLNSIEKCSSQSTEKQKEMNVSKGLTHQAWILEITELCKYCVYICLVHYVRMHLDWKRCELAFGTWAYMNRMIFSS